MKHAKKGKKSKDARVNDILDSIFGNKGGAHSGSSDTAAPAPAAAAAPAPAANATKAPPVIKKGPPPPPPKLTIRQLAMKHNISQDSVVAQGFKNASKGGADLLGMLRGIENNASAFLPYPLYVINGDPNQRDAIHHRLWKQTSHVADVLRLQPKREPAIYL